MKKDFKSEVISGNVRMVSRDGDILYKFGRRKIQLWKDENKGNLMDGRPVVKSSGVNGIDTGVWFYIAR